MRQNVGSLASWMHNWDTIRYICTLSM